MPFGVSFRLPLGVRLGGRALRNARSASAAGGARSARLDRRLLPRSAGAYLRPRGRRRGHPAAQPGLQGECDGNRRRRHLIAGGRVASIPGHLHGAERAGQVASFVSDCARSTSGSPRKAAAHLSTRSPYDFRYTKLPILGRSPSPTAATTRASSATRAAESGRVHAATPRSVTGSDGHEMSPAEIERIIDIFARRCEDPLFLLHRRRAAPARRPRRHDQVRPSVAACRSTSSPTGPLPRPDVHAAFSPPGCARRR